MPTMGFHAKMMEALSGGTDNMGPNVKALYDRFMTEEDEECGAAESQIVMLFGAAMTRDQQGQPLPDAE